MFDVVEKLGKLQEIFGGGPLAAFLGVALIIAFACGVGWFREVQAHKATLRELLPLVEKISTTWEHHLDLTDKLEYDMRLALAIFKALNPKLTPDETPRVGG